jgi:hypothetical protein
MTTPARQNQVRALVNHVAMEDAQAAPDVTIGMILVNANNAIMLFDSGASHSFIATSFVQKYNMPLSMLKNRMIVSSPGGDMHPKCHTPFRERGNEASIRVPRMFKSHVQ